MTEMAIKQVVSFYQSMVQVKISKRYQFLNVEM